MALVKAHIRRDNRSGVQASSNVIRAGEIEIRKDTYEAYKNGERVALSTREFQLLQFLMEMLPGKGELLIKDGTVYMNGELMQTTTVEGKGKCSDLNVKQEVMGMVNETKCENE